jgi:hypothetical protein
MMMRRLIAAAVFALAALPTYAATAPAVLTVESVLSPAWVERSNGRREPLVPGAALGSKDKVHTGDGGRAMLRLAEGSAIKLGESAMLSVDDLAQTTDAKGGIVAASLDVVRGAFRFTTGLLAKPSAQRDVRIRVNTVTVGIRGTDVWGRSEDERDIVCLLEGRITVTHGAAQFEMQQANSFYIAPRTGEAQPPSSVSPQQVKEWSEETEILPGTGAVRARGTGTVIAAPPAAERTAVALRNKLRDSGFPAIAAPLGGGSVEVRIEGLPDSTEAAALAARLRRIGYPQAQAR